MAAFLLALWALYQLRQQQIEKAFSTRLEERVAERTRIDTGYLSKSYRQS